MKLAGKHIGVAMAASHCNMERAIAAMGRLVAEGARVVPVVSVSLQNTTTRFGSPGHWLAEIERVTGEKPLGSIPEVEPFGPQRRLDCLVVMPCTGNTMAKLAGAINDGPVCMAAKAQLRNGRPVVLAITSNDALGMNARNLGALLAAKNIFFVPFRQDQPEEKPNSLDADVEEMLLPAVLAAMAGRQVQPLLLGPKG